MDQKDVYTFIPWIYNSVSLGGCAATLAVCIGEENLPGWVCAEDDEKTKPPFWCPLLACRVPVFSTKAQDLKVRANLEFFKMAMLHLVAECRKENRNIM